MKANTMLLMYRRCIYRCHRFLYTRSSVVYNGDAGKLFSYSDLMLCMCTQLRAPQTATRFLPPAPVIFVYIAAWLAVVQRQPAISQQLLLALALFFYFFSFSFSPSLSFSSSSSLGCFFAFDTSITFPRSLSSYLLHSFSLIQCGDVTILPSRRKCTYNTLLMCIYT